MGTSSFRAGTVIEMDGKAYKLQRKIADDIWQLEDIRTKRIIECSDIDLRNQYAAGRLIFASTDSNGMPACRDDVSQLFTPALWEEAKVRRIYVLEVLDIPGTRKLLAPIISNVWKRVGKPETVPNPATVLRWKSKYISAGRDITALVEQSHKKGNSTERYPKEVNAIIADAIENVYMTLEKKTKQDVLERAMTLVIRENRLRPASTQLPLPTRRLITAAIEAIPAFDRYAARHGRVAAVKKFRSVLAHRTTAAPLERAEMDHTLLDLMVIDDDTALPLGRPYITACIDDYTRCLLGIYIGFEPPSYLTVARSLKHAFLPKTDLCTKYPSIKNTWDAHGVCRELVVDNGAEFHSASLENACYALGIEIHYSARKTPWFKGKIERFLGTLNSAVAHGNPGTTFSNIFEKEEYNPSEHAVIRMSKLREIIYMWVVDVYHEKPHRTIKAPPAVVWKSSIKPEDILLPDDPAQLDAIMGRSEERTLTHKGIELDKLFYNSPELTDLRRKYGDKLKVEIRIDDTDIGHIIVLGPSNSGVFKVPSITPEYSTGLSYWQHKVCKNFAARELGKYDTTGWLEAKYEIARMIDEEIMHKKQKTRTRIARHKEATAMGAVANNPHPQQTLVAQDLPVPVPMPVAEPLTLEDIASPVTPTSPSKRFKPVYRERDIGQMVEDQSDMLRAG